MRPKLIFSDFDGTLTHGSSLGPIFFEILDQIERIDSKLIIVTGRSVSWAHFLLSHIDSLAVVITEGGGMISRKLEDGRLIDECQISDKEQQQLEEFCLLLKKKFSKVSLSADSFGRRKDRAIELSALSDNSLKKEIMQLMDDNAINFSCSNVHLNFWKGELSKAAASLKILKEKNLKKEDTLYFGDSLNDESMFKEFPYTVGVSNIVPLLDSFEYQPSVILRGEGLEGPKGVLFQLKSILD